MDFSWQLIIIVLAGVLSENFCVGILVKTFDRFPLVNKHKESKLKLHEFTYEITDANGLGRTFDGIGGLSGGGATSRLLVNYEEPYRSQILDFLFKPKFGASLHILKVEIGGDGQSTEGTEHSHMRSLHDENYTRGYEWWLMKEAKARNPNIKLVGLPWAWPGWIGQGTVIPYTNCTLAATYIAKWVKGAKDHHNLTIDYVGIWNERPYDVKYIKELRRILDQYGFKDVIIIAADDTFFFIAFDIMADPELANAIGVIGAHYPGTMSTKEAVKTGKQLWSSEDYSTFSDNVGGGCWARILNKNHVNGNMSATIAWNLIASYYDNLPYKRCSLMTANEPWSGHYELASPLWVTAHTTQFTEPGWYYLKAPGYLYGGGSFVALTDGKGNLTIIIETMSHEQSICIRPPLLPFTVEDQNVTFALDGSFKGKFQKLHYWKTELNNATIVDEMFLQQDDLQIDKEGKFHLFVRTNSLITLSSISNAKKGIFPTPPESSSFPIPYRETFDKRSEFSEAYNFADQAGAFETFYNASSTDGHSWTFRQVVTQRPLTWCDDPDHGVTVVGDFNWSSVNVSISAKIENTDGVFVALRVDKGGCSMRQAKGLYFWLVESGIWIITSDIGRERVLRKCVLDEECWISPFYHDDWNTMSLAISKDGLISVYLNGHLIWQVFEKAEYDIPANGFAALGTKTFGYAQFDDFTVNPL